MQALNTFFKDLAAKLSLPDFFKGSSLIFNNLFLALVAAVSFIGLLLIIFLVPGKKKNGKNAEALASDPSDKFDA